MRTYKPGNLIDYTISILIYSFGLIIEAFTFAIVFFAVSGYILSLIFNGISITVWSLLLIATFSLTLFTLILRNKKNFSELKRTISAKSELIRLIPYLILVPGFLIVMLSTRVQLSYHGAFHLGYINQVLQGSWPIENVVLPGFNANSYWLYNALIAVFGTILITPPPFAAVIVNIIVLTGSFYWINKSLIFLNLWNRKPFITSCFIIFTLFAINLFGIFHAIIEFYTQVSQADGFLHSFSNKHLVFVGIGRLSNLFAKFLSFNGFPTGVFYFSFAIYSSLLILREKLNFRNIFFLMISIVGALAFHATTGLYSLTVIPSALLITLIYYSKKNLKNVISNIKISDAVFLLLVALILFSPILYYVLDAARSLPPSNSGPHFMFALISVFSCIYPLMLILLIAIYLGFREINISTFFLSIVSIIGFFISVLLNLPGFNQYKFIFLTTIPFSILIVIAIDHLFYNASYKTRLVGTAIFLISLILLCLNISLVTFERFNSQWFTDQTYYYGGRKIYLSEGMKDQDVYEWIHQNSPQGTIVIVPFQSKNDSNVYTIAERLPYVVDGRMFAVGFEEYQSRLNNINMFYDQGTPSSFKLQIIERFKKFDSQKPSILLIPKSNLDKNLVNSAGLNLIFSGKDTNVYSFDN